MELQKTPLFSWHQAAGAEMNEFAGFSMPIKYSGIIPEHHTVRQRAGLFDVSHMGGLSVTGKQSTAFLQNMLTCDLDVLAPGRVAYAFLCNEQGGILEDLLLYRLAPDKYFLVVNAANRQSDYSWLLDHSAPCPDTVPLPVDPEDDIILTMIRDMPGLRNLNITDASSSLAILAVQGPLSGPLVMELLGTGNVAIKYFHFAQVNIGPVHVILSRTGYTGEDGYEIFCPAEASLEIWEQLMVAGSKFGLLPCGLGARDTLRLEAGLPLYGHELTENHTPLEAGLTRFVHLEKKEFIGRRALRQQVDRGVVKRLCGLRLSGRIARPDSLVYHGDDCKGVVTSGAYAPTLQESIAMAYLDLPLPSSGTELQVQLKGRLYPARLSSLPFVKR